MILEIALIIILIVIIALIIKYIYVQAHILSSKEFRKTAEKKASKIKINTADITCDYCGCLINTKEHKVCPNCGAPITNLGQKFCEYCGTAVQELNIKVWSFSNVKLNDR